MTINNKKQLSPERQEELLGILAARFEQNRQRHKSLQWEKVRVRLLSATEKLWSLNEMEQTGGQPDVVGHDPKTGEYIFYDCSPESPGGRRSACYDRQAQEERKKFPPETNAIDMAESMGVSLLNEEEYRLLQQLGPFDTKTSSWLNTPLEIRELGGAIFGDYRFGRVFTYHNGADSYYAARGFRCSLRV